MSPAGSLRFSIKPSIACRTVILERVRNLPCEMLAHGFPFQISPAACYLGDEFIIMLGRAGNGADLTKNVFDHIDEVFWHVASLLGRRHAGSVKCQLRSLF